MNLQTPNPRKGIPRSPGVREKMRAARWKNRPTMAERFWAKVEKRGPDECWEWKGAKMNDPKWRHGALYLGVVEGKEKVIGAHRASLMLHGFELVKGLHIDHICRNGMCVNPAHLHQVPPRINALENNSSPFALNAKKVACNKGHHYGRGTYLLAHCKGPKGNAMVTRVCVICHPSFGKRSPHRIFKMPHEVN